MNCPDCNTPMRREDPDDGGWPRVVYRCPTCHPRRDTGLANLDEVEFGDPRPINNIQAKGKRL